MKRLTILTWITLLTSITLHAQTPAAPSNVTARFLDSNTLLMSWQDNSNNEDGFSIVNAFAQYLGDVGPNTTSVQITGFFPGASVQFSVASFIDPPNYIFSEFVSTPVLVVPSEEIARFGHELRTGESFDVALVTNDNNLLESVQVTGLPEWAVLNSSTGRISGTAPQPTFANIDVTANFSDDSNISGSVSIRVIAPLEGPEVVKTLDSVEMLSNSSGVSFELNDFFEDPDTVKAARVQTDLGTFDIALYERATPATVANFLRYVNDSGSSSYNGSFFHRSLSGFVIQGGGYRPSGGEAFTSVSDFLPIANEPGLENVRGTLAMAKIGGDPDSATNEFFVSLGDNRANLDFQNGGFTVFGRIAGDGMTVIDAIAALPTGNYTTITVDGITRSTLLTDCPMNAATAPASMDQSLLADFTEVSEIDPLAYEIINVSGDAVLSHSVDGNILELSPTGGTGGVASLTLRVTDLDGNFVDQVISVTIRTPFEQWAIDNGLNGSDAELLSDPDGDGVLNLAEFAYLTSPNTHDAMPVLFGTTDVDGSEYLSLAFTMRNDSNLSAIYSVLAQDQLTGLPQVVWTNVGFMQNPDNVVTSETLSDRTNIVIRDSEPMDNNATRFMKLEVEEVSLPAER